MNALTKIVTVILLLTMSLDIQAQPLTPKPKRIYITLDVSGSMVGNKYLMANYAAQALTVFRNPEDIVMVYYLGTNHNITGSEGYKQLQIPYDTHKDRSSYFEVSDLSKFLRDYKSDPHYQDWLFIIGDGDWDYAHQKYDDTVKAFAELLAKEQIQVCYLQTGNTLEKDYAFTNFLMDQHSDYIDVRRSDTTAVSVLSNCIYFANKILGFSHSSVQLHKDSNTDVSFCSELPLERCLLVYQSDQRGGGELGITSVLCKEKTIHSRVRGNPSTKPLVKPGATVVNGIVWELSCPQTIPANDTIRICFNQKVDASKLTLYPFVDVAVRMRPWSVALDTLREEIPNIFLICNKENQVLVKISVTDKFTHKFPPPLMQRMDVKLRVDDKEVLAGYCEEDTTFQVTLPMPDDTISYISMVECPGYFSRVSSRQIVTKANGVCPPERVPLITLPVQQFCPISFHSLLSGNEAVGAIRDSLFQTVSASSAFDQATITGPDSWMLEDVQLSFDGNQVKLIQKPISDLCECAFPDTLLYEVTLVSSKGIVIGDKSYQGFVMPISVPIDQRSWWNRCHIYIIVGIGLLLFLVYLRFLMTKKRFRKNAMMTPIYYDYYGNKIDDQGGTSLREDGFAAWFARWFVPGRERNTLYFDAPELSGLAIEAGDSNAVVHISKSCIDPSIIEIVSYKPHNDNDPSKYVKLGDNEKIYIKKTNGDDAGYLTFTCGEENDGGTYRVFLIILMLASIAAEVFIIYTLIKSVSLFAF